MVRGIEIFREYFKNYPDSYIIIGGTACDIAIEAAGLIPRATKDIDIIVVIEALRPDFVKQFWKFIADGKYGEQQKSETDRKYYRFLKPADPDFPQQIELFSRKPDVIDSAGIEHLTPIPVDDDLSSLSAILMDESYYNYTLAHSIEDKELKLAQTEALICLKVKAFIDMQERKEQGKQVNDKTIKKHKLDVFRLALLLAADTVFELPHTLKTDLSAFADAVKNNLPDTSVFKEMGAANINVDALFKQFLNNFSLNR
ncbi:MAG: hypothetical protein V1799_00470 [bacterium]